jgi:hypothetical protein
MKRILTPEILDRLAPDDPRAIHSRRDLALINRAMRQPAIMARVLAHFPPPRTLADLGGGDGRFLLAVARRLGKRWPGVTALVCDQVAAVSDKTRSAFSRLGWSLEVRHGDIFQQLPDADVMMANLFLHHFGDDRLSDLLARVAASTSIFVACEPRRNGLALLGARMVWALGANDVTRHDAVASVRAGFSGLELAALWPPDGDIRWHLEEDFAFPFSHVFTAHA